MSLRTSTLTSALSSVVSAGIVARLAFQGIAGHPVLAALLIAFVLWLARNVGMQLAFALWPQRFPSLHALERPAWELRLPSAERAVRELGALGFEEIGVKDERFFLGGVHTRELWHAEQRTYASVASTLFIPRVSFLTAGQDGRLVYSGAVITDESRNLVSRIARGRSIAARFEDHLLALRAAGIVAAEPVRDGSTPSHAELLARRLELCRAWYVAAFASDAQWDAWKRTKGAT